eukprot:3936469-Rhodomonas_salina.1
MHTSGIAIGDHPLFRQTFVRKVHLSVTTTKSAMKPAFVSVIARPTLGACKKTLAGACRPHLAAAALMGRRTFNTTARTDSSVADVQTMSKEQILMQVQRLPLSDVSAIAKHYNKEQTKHKQKTYPTYASLLQHRFRVMAEVT